MATKQRRLASFAAGMLCANSLPHLATAVTGRQHLTPVRGRRSSRWVNAAWGTANLVAGLLLVRKSAQGTGGWDSRLVAFNVGAAVFAAWMAGSEAVLKTNSAQGHSSPAGRR